MGSAEIVVAALVLMAADSGEMDSVADVDVMLGEMAKSNHRDGTWRVIMDSLLDVRAMVAGQELAAALSPMK